MELIFWADQSWDVSNYKSEIRFEIDRLFREHKIVIPYPKRSVIIENQG
jgi:small-conductance mechanosensitive channel